MLRGLLFLSYIFLQQNLFAQDTLSIEKFDSLLILHYSKMKTALKSKDSISGEEAVILIKIENTLSYGVEKFIGGKEFETRKEKYLSFDSCFMKYFIKQTIIKTDAVLNYGLGWYSKKYDIMLGGNMTDPNSRYYIRLK